jgi:DNA-directed RNA polymerase specialized sigma24 family protein
MEQTDFRAFYQKTAPRLRMYIARSCGSVDLADDILQEVYLRFLRAASLRADDKSRRAYLYRIADSIVIDHFRRLRRENSGMLPSVSRYDRRDQELRYDIRCASLALSHSSDRCCGWRIT